MSLVASLNERLFESDSKGTEAAGDQWIDEVVGELIGQHAELLAKVETGQVEQSVLELELSKVLDRQGMSGGRRERLRALMNHMFGYGILQSYLENPQVTDLIGTSYDHFFVKIKGETQRIPVRFADEKRFENYCKLIVIRNGGMLNENDNHARVADEQLKLRINAVIPPRSAKGAFLAIRKHRSTAYDLEDLKELDMLDDVSMEWVEKIATGSSRFIVCGKGAAGKTTLLRAMINAVGEQQRLLICEADTELYPDSPTAIVQKVIQRGAYGKTVTLNDLVKDGLTMSLDGYCIGEITGPEAWDFVKAGYTDHRVMGTIHSSGAEELVHRLLVLSEIAKLGIGEAVAQDMISRSVDYVIYLKDFQLRQIHQFEKDSLGKIALKPIYERGALSTYDGADEALYNSGSSRVADSVGNYRVSSSCKSV